MRDLPPPFRFDLRSLLSGVRRKVNSRVDGVCINLPFVTFNVKPDDLEQKIARELVIRLADRRVLNAFECCDDCIDRVRSHRSRRFDLSLSISRSSWPKTPMVRYIC